MMDSNDLSGLSPDAKLYNSGKILPEVIDRFPGAVCKIGNGMQNLPADNTAVFQRNLRVERKPRGIRVFPADCFQINGGVVGFSVIYSLIMKIMFKAVEATIAKGFGGKKDYENPEFRMLMNSSAGSPLRSMMISGGMKSGVLPGMLEMANGHFFRGIWKMIKG